MFFFFGCTLDISASVHATSFVRWNWGMMPVCCAMASLQLCTPLFLFSFVYFFCFPDMRWVYQKIATILSVVRWHLISKCVCCYDIYDVCKSMLHWYAVQIYIWYVNWLLRHGVHFTAVNCECDVCVALAYDVYVVYTWDFNTLFWHGVHVALAYDVFDIHTYIHTYMHTHILTYMWHIHTYIYTYVWHIYIRMRHQWMAADVFDTHTCIHTYVYTYIPTNIWHIHMYIYTYVWHIYTCMSHQWTAADVFDIHTYIHTYIYTYIHTYLHT